MYIIKVQMFPLSIATAVVPWLVLKEYCASCSYNIVYIIRNLLAVSKHY